jgi:hypothetical protein
MLKAIAREVRRSLDAYAFRWSGLQLSKIGKAAI